jgi:uncharacterized membrane protein
MVEPDGEEVTGVEVGVAAVGGAAAAPVEEAAAVGAAALAAGVEVPAAEAHQEAGEIMEPKIFINTLDDQKIVAAIAEAEKRSSGEIRLFITHHKVSDCLAEAQKQFALLQMDKTRERNGVLIYFAPKVRGFAIWGDLAVHEKCGENFWVGIRDAMVPLLKDEKFTEALLLAIREVGEALAKHFPRQSDDKDELPNEIVGD